MTILDITVSDPMELPGFLLFFGDANTDLATLSEEITQRGGQVVAGGSASGNQFLEPGTPARSIVFATLPSRSLALDMGREIGKSLDPAIVMLGGTCLPQTGPSDFPAQDNAASVVSAGPPAYMVIEGTVTEPEPMGRYRDIIFPMIIERGAYYAVYAAAVSGQRDTIEVLHGDWTDQALIVSCWPDTAAARDFWYCDRYQNLAIPTRTGAGRFSVTLLAPS